MYDASIRTTLAISRAVTDGSNIRRMSCTTLALFRSIMYSKSVSLHQAFIICCSLTALYCMASSAFDSQAVRATLMAADAAAVDFAFTFLYQHRRR